jgi:hypothetical protein
MAYLLTHLPRNRPRHGTKTNSLTHERRGILTQFRHSLFAGKVALRGVLRSEGTSRPMTSGWRKTGRSSYCRFVLWAILTATWAWTLSLTGGIVGWHDNIVFNKAFSSIQVGFPLVGLEKNHTRPFPGWNQPRQDGSVHLHPLYIPK